MEGISVIFNKTLFHLSFIPFVLTIGVCFVIILLTIYLVYKELKGVKK